MGWGRCGGPLALDYQHRLAWAGMTRAFGARLAQLISHVDVAIAV